MNIPTYLLTVGIGLLWVIALAVGYLPSSKPTGFVFFDAVLSGLFYVSLVWFYYVPALLAIAAGRADARRVAVWNALTGWTVWGWLRCFEAALLKGKNALHVMHYLQRFNTGGYRNIHKIADFALLLSCLYLYAIARKWYEILPTGLTLLLGTVVALTIVIMYLMLFIDTLIALLLTKLQGRLRK